jgi:hypothetical protein
VFYLDVAKVDLVLHMLQRSDVTHVTMGPVCYSCWGVVHARGMRRGMEAGAHGRACMRVWKAEEGRDVRMKVPACARTHKMEEHAPDPSHADILI